MPTYAENAHKREIASRRRVQDARDAVQHRAFDLQAQDKTPKSARPHWAVVGEGSRTANENYLKNYARIFPTCRPDAASRPVLLTPSRPGVGAAG
jgi:hypothetical protein